MVKRFCCLLITLFYVDVLSADVLNIFNGSDQDVYVSTYYVHDKHTYRSGSIQVISPEQSCALQQPSYQLYSIFPPQFYDRELVCTTNSSLLYDSMESNALLQMPHVNIGSMNTLLSGDTFFIVQDQGILSMVRSGGLQDFTNKMQGKARSAALSPIRYLIKRDQAAIQEWRAKIDDSVVAQVKRGSALSEQELEWQQRREEKIRESLQAYLDLPAGTLADKTVPKIACIGSGGGYRAMISTLGFLTGADEIGLLDLTMYISALSGSTWGVGAWISRGGSVRQARDAIFDNIEINLENTIRAERKLMVDHLLVRFAYDEPLSLVDIFGIFLANRLLGDNDCQKVYLCQQYDQIFSGHYPFPLYAAVEGRFSASLAMPWEEQYGGASANKPWFEFNPIEFGTAEYGGAYIPAWAVNRTFNNGFSTNSAPGVTMGKVFGTCGSAFAASHKQIWQEVKGAIEEDVAGGSIIASHIEGFLIKSGASDLLRECSIPFTRAEFPNFMFGMYHPLKNIKNIKLKDAGLGHSNLPFPLVSGERSGRQMDVLIFLDASSNVAGDEPEGEMIKVIEYARARDLSFPIIDRSTLRDTVISVYDEDPNKPIVIYMPLYNDQNRVQQLIEDDPVYYQRFSDIIDFDSKQCIADGPCGTFERQVSRENSNKMSLVAECNMVSSADMIKEVVRKAVERKAGITLPV